MDKKLNKHLIQIGITSNILEWYEFGIYAYLANVLGQVFFQSASNITALINAFAVFAIGYLARPLGSLYFGRRADKYHAGVSLKTTLILMTVPTFLIGMLPTYNTAGYVAVVLLVILRMIQGFAMGGESPLIVSYLYISSPCPSKRIFFCSFRSFSAGIGFILASSTAYLLHVIFTQETINAWAWRIPFLLGLPISCVVLYLRKSIPAHVKIANTLTPIIQKQYGSKLIKALIMVSFMEVMTYVLFVWMPSYLHTFLGVASTTAMATNVGGLSLQALMALFFGYIGQYINPKRSYLTGVLLSVLSVYPLLLFLQHITTLAVLITVQMLFAVLLACISINTFFMICDSFSVEIRNRAMGMCVTFPPAIIGGTAPFLCSYFIHVWHFNNFPAIYIMILGAMALLANIFL